MRETVIFCIGSDRISGDRLGPEVGSLLRYKYNVPCYVYGVEGTPVNGVNLPEYRRMAAQNHPCAFTLAVDAAVGERSDLGKIKFRRGGVKAGGALGEGHAPLGDVSVMGVVAVKSDSVMTSLLEAPFALVESLAEKIARIIAEFLLSAAV